MVRLLFTSAVVLLATMLFAPLPVLLSLSGASDQADMYLLIRTQPKAQEHALLSQFDVREISMQRAPFALMIQADPQAHARLIQAGHWLLPASTFAAICGVPRPPSVEI